MTAFTIVRFRTKLGREQAFLDAHRNVAHDWPGLVRADIVKTGERAYCLVVEWPDMETMAAARPSMIATLNTFRDALEDLGGGLGVTDPVAGPVAIALK